jgi:hypothetical protein
MPRKPIRTTQNYLAGIGAGGALLACALVAFFFMVGGAAVTIWPDSGPGGSPQVVQLQAPPAAVQLAEADGLIASTDLAPAVVGADHDGGGNGGGAEGPATPPDRTPPSPPSGDDSPPEGGTGAPPEAPQGGPGEGRESDGNEDEGPNGFPAPPDGECDAGLVGRGPGLGGDPDGDDWRDHQGDGWGRGGPAVWPEDPQEDQAGLTFPSGPEDGHDDTAWTSKDS